MLYRQSLKPQLLTETEPGSQWRETGQKEPHNFLRIADGAWVPCPYGQNEDALSPGPSVPLAEPGSPLVLQLDQEPCHFPSTLTMPFSAQQLTIAPCTLGIEPKLLSQALTYS